MNKKEIENNYQKVFPTRLRELMKEHNENQQTLANVLGKQRQTISLYVTGSTNPDYETLKQIAEHYQVTSDWLIGIPSATKELDIDIAKVCDFTGLSERAIGNITLGFKKDEFEKLQEKFSSRYIENEEMPNYVFSPSSYSHITLEEMPDFKRYAELLYIKGTLYSIRQALNILLESDALKESLLSIHSAIEHAYMMNKKVTLVFTDNSERILEVDSLSPQEVVRNELRNAFDGLYESIFSQLKPEKNSYGKKTNVSVDELITTIFGGGQPNGNSIS